MPQIDISEIITAIYNRVLKNNPSDVFRLTFGKFRQIMLMSGCIRSEPTIKTKWFLLAGSEYSYSSDLDQINTETDSAIVLNVDQIKADIGEYRIELLESEKKIKKIKKTTEA